MSINKNEQTLLTEYLSDRDGKKYTKMRVLKFAREALCFMGRGCQTIISTEHAKQIVREAAKAAFTSLPQ